MEEINIETKKTPIPEGLKLEGLGDFNIIVGENNVGKTRLFEAINEQFDEHSIYIEAKVIKADELKTGADASLFVSNVAEIFKKLKLKQNIDKKFAAIAKGIINSSNADFEKITESDKKMPINENDTIKAEWVVRSLLKDTEKELKTEGQGHQRLMTALFLKNCLEKNPTKEDKIILFEEPEIFLHPKLKRELNTLLVEISKQKKVQLIISTHDPFFAFASETEEGITFKRYCLSKENDETKVNGGGFVGLDDELIHIFLYNQLCRKLGVERLDGVSKFSKIPRPYKPAPGRNDKVKTLQEYIRNQIHHKGDNPNTKGFVSDNSFQSKTENYYTGEELKKSIEEMTKELY